MLGSRGYLSWVRQPEPRSFCARRAALGGGVPAGQAGERRPSRHSCTAARDSPFEKAAFTRKRPVGKNYFVMRKTVPPSYHEDGGSWPP